jgi:outer membrane biosynthesis protein TonB
MSKKLWFLVLMAPVAAACSHAQAKTTPEMPPLEMPVPPPRDVQPTEVEAPQPVPLVTEPAHNPPARLRPSAPPPRPEPKPAEPPKPEPPVDAEPPKPADELPKPLTTLQTTPATAEAEVERGIRASILHANTDLNRIDYRALNTDARTQYDSAKRFLQQADEAIRTKNLVLAKTVAEKAAVIAAQLAGR